jgi:hypothetical protein
MQGDIAFRNHPARLAAIAANEHLWTGPACPKGHTVRYTVKGCCQQCILDKHAIIAARNRQRTAELRELQDAKDAASLAKAVARAKAKPQASARPKMPSIGGGAIYKPKRSHQAKEEQRARAERAAAKVRKQEGLVSRRMRFLGGPLIHIMSGQAAVARSHALDALLLDHAAAELAELRARPMMNDMTDMDFEQPRAVA